MMKGKFLILFCLISLIISMSCVSASEDFNQSAEGDIIDSGNDFDISDVSSSEDDVETAGPGSFSDLEQMITDAAVGSTIDLKKDYVRDSGFPYDEISINKPLTINGNGHTIDALGQSRIFYCYSNNVILNNITFKNANASYGAAVYFSPRVYTSPICNCSVSGTFINNTARDDGGAVYFKSNASSCKVSGIFKNNHAGEGGAVYFAGDVSDLSISGEFIDNVASTGGAIYFSNQISNSKINATFVNNAAKTAGAIYFLRDVADCSVSGKFINNTASYGAGAISATGFLDSSISGEFINNAASYGGAIFCFNMSNSNVSGVFTNNAARDDGGAMEFYHCSGSEISGIFRNNSAETGSAVKIQSSILDSSISGEFIGNVAGDFGYIISLCPDVSDCSVSGKFINNTSPIISQGSDLDCRVNNSIILLNPLSPGKVILGDICWFGNNANDYDMKPYSYAESWLFLDSSVIPRKNKGEFNVELTLNNLFDSASGTITHPDVSGLGNVKFELSAVNGTLSKNSVSLDESVIFKFTGNNEKGMVNAVYNGLSYSFIVSALTLDAPNLSKYYSSPERFTVTVRMYGEPLVGETVSIHVNGKVYNRTADANGQASMGINLNSGVYKVISECNGIEVQSLITIRPTVLAGDITKIFRNDTQYYATFVDSQGNPLKNTEVKFNINGVFYKKTTDENGIAKLNINLNPGTYVLTAENPKTGEFQSSTVTVLSSIVENHDLTKYYRNASQYSVRLLDSRGNPVKAGVNVRFNINGVFYNKASDDEGYVKLNINLSPGEYIITVEYNDLKASNTIKVLSTIETRNMGMSYKDGSQFKATILDGLGRPYAGQNVTFNINGIIYHKISDEKGIAGLTINLMPGEYIITTTYNYLNVANTITIS